MRRDAMSVGCKVGARPCAPEWGGCTKLRYMGVYKAYTCDITDTEHCHGLVRLMNTQYMSVESHDNRRESHDNRAVRRTTRPNLGSRPPCHLETTNPESTSATLEL